MKHRIADKNGHTIQNLNSFARFPGRNDRAMNPRSPVIVIKHRSRRAVFSLAVSIALLIPIVADVSRARQAQGAAVPSTPVTPWPMDFGKLGQEATSLLSAYVQINTTDPPGNELGAARMLKEKFLANGIPATVFESSPGRGIVLARLHGIHNRNKSIILLSHIDV